MTAMILRRRLLGERKELLESAHPRSAAARRWILADDFMIPNLPKPPRLLESYTCELS